MVTSGDGALPELCFLCGSAGQEAELLRCVACCEPAHPFCLSQVFMYWAGTTLQDELVSSESRSGSVTICLYPDPLSFSNHSFSVHIVDVVSLRCLNCFNVTVCEMSLNSWGLFTWATIKWMKKKLLRYRYYEILRFSCQIQHRGNTCIGKNTQNFSVCVLPVIMHIFCLCYVNPACEMWKKRLTGTNINVRKILSYVKFARLD